MQRTALCRSRRELSNAYFLAKVGFDTADNEPCKVCPLSAYRPPRSFCTLVTELCYSGTPHARGAACKEGPAYSLRNYGFRSPTRRSVRRSSSSTSGRLSRGMCPLKFLPIRNFDLFDVFTLRWRHSCLHRSSRLDVQSSFAFPVAD